MEAAATVPHHLRQQFTILKNPMKAPAQAVQPQQQHYPHSFLTSELKLTRCSTVNAIAIESWWMLSTPMDEIGLNEGLMH
jgi:hypothetical protein